MLNKLALAEIIRLNKKFTKEQKIQVLKYIKETKAEDLEHELILQEQPKLKPRMLVFYAIWAKEWRTNTKQIIDQISKKYSNDLSIKRINVDNKPTFHIVAKFGIKHVPVIILIKNNSIVKRFDQSITYNVLDKEISKLI